MRLLKYLYVLVPVLLLSLLVFVPAKSQNTAPSPISFDILDPDFREQLQCWGYVEWDNTYGSAVRTVAARMDSVREVLVDDERRWKISIDSLRAGGSDSTVALVTVAGMARRDKATPFVAYQDSLFFLDTAELLNMDFLPGIDIMMEDSASANVAVGDSVELVYLRRTYDPHWRRLTYDFPSTFGLVDTLVPDGTQKSYGPVSNEFEYINFYVDATSNSSSTACRMGINYQVKKAGTDHWIGDANDATRVEDSCLVGDDDITVVRGGWSVLRVSHITAGRNDSLRFVVHERSAKGFVYIRGVMIEQHN